METNESDFWQGYHAALLCLDLQVDILLSTCYNDSRTKDPLLDLKSKIKEFKNADKSLPLHDPEKRLDQGVS